MWRNEAYILVTWQAVPLEKVQSQCTPESPWSQGPALAVKSQLDTPSLAAIRRRTRTAKGDCKNTVSAAGPENTAFELVEEKEEEIKTNLWLVDS